MTLSYSIEVKANIEKVFDFLTDFEKIKTSIPVLFELFGCKIRAEIDRTRKRALLFFRSLLKRLPILLAKWIERI